MAKVGILTEKPSASRNFGKALGGMSGTFEGTEYVIVAARGHLLELKDPSEMVPADKVAKYKGWDIADLPWNSDDFRWEREVRKKMSGKGKTAKKVTDGDAKSLLADLKKTLSGCTEIVCAADLDPTGEGSLLGWEIVEHLGLDTGRKLSRMEFYDETESSLQKSFRERRAVTGIWDEGDFRMADFRSKWDMMSMQFTRVATKVSGSPMVLRNGRLKSAMVSLVGDGLDAHNNYVKKAFYENRFKDENGVVYSDPEIDRFEDKSAVPGGLTSPAVVTHDGTTRKKTAPPKLLDLAGLSALLGKRGFSPKDVLSTYQKLYEVEWASYPRTEDRVVSEEQFKELLPLIDKIAGVVGIDTAALSHRSPRKTHVKNGGAHGANRPGLKVPASLEAVEAKFGKLGREIYETLAKNYLTMLAPDYEYDQHKGHIEPHPSFVGSISVPAVMGWKSVFIADDDDIVDASEAKSLGSSASVFVHEGFPPRPPHPNMTWLMKQLERRSVGTGATRTSTYAEVTSGPRALMADKRGRITLSESGELNHRLLPGTKIGDLGLTESVFADMAAIEAGTLTTDDALRPVADLITHDIEQMTKNAANLPADLKEKLMTSTTEKFSGNWNGKAVNFKREWSGHRFTDDECANLCADEVISVTATSKKTGNEFTVKGKLEDQKFTNDKGETIEFIGFKPDFTPDPSVYAVGQWQGRQIKFKKAWGGAEFTAEQIDALFAGKAIEITRTSKKGNEYTVSGKLEDQKYNGSPFVGFKADFGDK